MSSLEYNIMWPLIYMYMCWVMIAALHSFRSFASTVFTFYCVNYYDCPLPHRHASDVMETSSWTSLVSGHSLLVAEVFKALALTTLPRKRPRMSNADQGTGHSSCSWTFVKLILQSHLHSSLPPFLLFLVPSSSHAVVYTILLYCSECDSHHACVLQL